MNFFFHHVGSAGSRRDFPKTVFSTIPVPRILDAIPDAIPQKHAIRTDLEKSFPTAVCNVWGVPRGAATVLNHLEEGDAMLLVGSTHWIGSEVPAFGIIKVFPRTLLVDLSKELWGETGFPYVFFFETERIQLHWQEFVEHVGYKSNFDPRGMVYRVKPERLARFGGPRGYVEFLRREHTEGKRHHHE